MLHPIGNYDVRGGPDPATWVYRCVRHGPSRTTTTLLSADAVLHFRYAVDAVAPMEGRRPAGLGDQAGQPDRRCRNTACRGSERNHHADIAYAIERGGRRRR